MIDGSTLLSIARGAVRAKLGGAAHAIPEVAWLRAPAAAFVTLRKGAALHGCIGTVEASRPLGETIARNAVLAAFEDPRSRPLRADELDEIRIEVSVLSRPSRIEFGTEREAIERIEPFVDGLILSSGGSRGVLLPQVWRALPEPRRFLGALKVKAGIAEHAWPDGIALERFTVSKFSEDGYSRG